MTLRLAILNDFEVVVRGLHGMLEPYADRVRVVELDANRPVRQEVDVVLWDTFGQPSARRAGTALYVRGLGARVVVYSWHAHAEVVDDALRRGADGFVAKSVTADALVDALERVASGEQVRVAEQPRAACRPGCDWPGREHGLTERESEILALIASGLSNQEIADQAFLSINSVKTYIRTAYRKMGVARRSQAVGWALGHGFVPDSRRAVPDRDHAG